MQQPRILPHHLSVSSIRTLFQCGIKFYMEQIQPMRLPGASTGPMARGSALDKAATAHFKLKAVNGKGLNLNEFIELEMDDLTANYNTTNWDKPFGEVKLMAAAQALTYWQTFGQNLSPFNANSVQQEVTMTLPGMQIPVMGIIDLITADGIIVDNKLSKNTPKIYEVERNWQLITYALLTGHTKGAIALTTDLQLKPKTHYFEIDITNEMMDQMANRFRLAERQILTGVLMPAPEGSWYCNHMWCKFWDNCEFGALPNENKWDLSE
jgi:hypothetical protein